MSERKKINALILSIYRDLAEAFLEPLGPEQRNELAIGDYLVKFDIVAGDPGQDPTSGERIAKAGAIAFVVRFLDVLSLDKIKTIYRSLPNEIAIPMAFFFLREKGEVDFKISCPSCGQKLWLRDTDIGKRGRCPNCKKPFMILSQADHLRSQLMLPQSVPIVKLILNDPDSFQAAMTKLMDAVSMGIKPAAAELTAEALKQATVRVQIQEP